MILAPFGIVFCSGNGSYFEQIEVVLALIEPMVRDNEPS
jgi:hypothetical protein